MFKVSRYADSVAIFIDQQGVDLMKNAGYTMENDAEGVPRPVVHVEGDERGVYLFKEHRTANSHRLRFSRLPLARGPVWRIDIQHIDHVLKGQLFSSSPSCYVPIGGGGMIPWPEPGARVPLRTRIASKPKTVGHTPVVAPAEPAQRVDTVLQHEISLAEAVRAVNTHRIRLGKNLVLDFKEDGSLRALVEHG